VLVLSSAHESHAALAGRVGKRSPVRRGVRVRRALDRHLLPSFLRQPPAAAHTGDVLPIPEAAEREGFRACRRCRPADATGSDPAIALVREACRALDAGRAPTTDAHRLARAFKRVLGITPRAYADARRVARFKHELKRRKSVSPALYEAGYSSSSRVYERTTRSSA